MEGLMIDELEEHSMVVGRDDSELDSEGKVNKQSHDRNPGVPRAASRL